MPPSCHGTGPLGSTPSVVTSSPGVIDVFWKGLNNRQLYRKRFDGLSWLPHENLRHETVASSPMAVGQPDGTIDVFWKRTDGALGHAWLTYGTWYGPENLGGAIG